MTQCHAEPARKPRAAVRYIRRNHMPIAALLLVAFNTAIVAAILWRGAAAQAPAPAPIVIAVAMPAPAPQSVVRVVEKVRHKHRHHHSCRCHK